MKDYTKMNPAEIDNILVNVLNAKDAAEFTVAQAVKHLAAYYKRMETYKELAENGYSAKTRKEYAPKVVELEALISGTTENRIKADAKYDACIKEIVIINREFDSRGGWNRFWLVDNINGHIHSSRQCSTCFMTTQFALLPDQSGMHSTELVELSGEKSCTVCFPFAPVNVLNRPSQLEAPERKKQRLERESAKIERERIKAEKTITAPDGSPLRIPGGLWKITTANEAIRILVSNLTDKLAVDKGYREVHNPSYESEKEEQNVVLLEALVSKYGKTAEELMADYVARAERKLKRDWKGFPK